MLFDCDVLALKALLIGCACWLSDMHLCDRIQRLPFNPQGHAWYDCCTQYCSLLISVLIVLIGGTSSCQPIVTLVPHSCNLFVHTSLAGGRPFAIGEEFFRLFISKRLAIESLMKFDTIGPRMTFDCDVL